MKPLDAPEKLRDCNYLLDHNESERLGRNRVSKYTHFVGPWVEDFFGPFDEWGIGVCQRLYDSGRWMHVASMFWTLATTIELGAGLPLVLYFAGFDAQATEMFFLMFYTAMISQVPKRFLWRDRPYMARRAAQHRPDATSSLPSRAVTCAVVYSFAIMYCSGSLVEKGVVRNFVALLIMFLCALLTSISRVAFGVHYPSDCALGMLQGAFIVLLSISTEEATALGCKSCTAGACYQTSSDALSVDNFYHLFPWRVAFTVGACAVFACWLLMCRPLRFWAKCHHILGLLGPCLAFELTCLCYPANRMRAGLPQPNPQLRSWLSWVVGVVMNVIAGAIGLSTRPVKRKRYHLTQGSAKLNDSEEYNTDSSGASNGADNEVSGVILTWFHDNGNFGTLGGAWICWGSFIVLYALLYGSLVYWRVYGPYR